MPIDNQEIIKLLSTLAKEEKLKVTVRKCIQSGFIVGGTAAVGGLLLGPVGLAIGAAISGCCTALSQKNQFESIVDIIDGMTSDEKAALAENVRDIIRHLDATDAVALAGLLSGNTNIRRLVMNELIHFVNNEARKVVANHQKI